MLVRMVKRHTALETTDPELVLKVVFSDDDGGPDLSASTYLIEPNRLVQTRSEHCAGSGLDRPMPCASIDLSGLHDALEATPGNEWFSYADSTHRELKFKDRDELLDLIVRLLEREPAKQNDDVTAAQCKDYVRRMHASRDAEWTHFFEQHHKGPKWKRFVGSTD